MVFLHKGSWRTFQLVLLRKECAIRWPPNVDQKILQILQGEEIRERFLSAFPPLRADEKLDLSLDEIINPLEIMEEKSHQMGCHPGRLTLDPERYNMAWSEKRNGNPGYGYAKGPYGIPPHMVAFQTGYMHSPSTGKHRLLDVSSETDFIELPHRLELTEDFYKQRDLTWGLQDMYFLGGMPLEFWHVGDSMGMKVRWYHGPCSENFQGLGTAFRATTEEEERDWTRITECLRTYCFSRMWYLPTEREWLTLGGGALQGGEFVEICDRKPRTVGGNEWWTTGQAEMSGDDNDGQELGHNVYIRYIQKIEDFDEAARFWSARGLEGLVYWSRISRNSDSSQCISIGGYV